MPDPIARERQGCCDTHIWVDPSSSCHLDPSLLSSWQLDIQAPRDTVWLLLLVQTIMLTHTQPSRADLSWSHSWCLSVLIFSNTDALTPKGSPWKPIPPSLPGYFVHSPASLSWSLLMITHLHTYTHSSDTWVLQPIAWLQLLPSQTALSRHWASPGNVLISKPFTCDWPFFTPSNFIFLVNSSKILCPPHPFPDFVCFFKHIIFNSVQSWTALLLHPVIGPIPLIYYGNIYTYTIYVIGPIPLIYWAANTPQSARLSGQLFLLTVLTGFTPGSWVWLLYGTWKVAKQGVGSLGVLN